MSCLTRTILFKQVFWRPLELLVGAFDGRYQKRFCSILPLSVNNSRAWFFEFADEFSMKNGVLRNFQNSQENTCAWVSFLIKALVQVFSCEFYKNIYKKIYKNTFFTEYFQTTSSGRNFLWSSYQINFIVLLE